MTPLGATAARVAALTAGTFAAAVIDGGESSDIAALQKSGKLKMLFGEKINPSEEGSHARVGTTAA